MADHCDTGLRLFGGGSASSSITTTTTTSSADSSVNSASSTKANLSSAHASFGADVLAQRLSAFRDWYWPLHGYACLLICLIGASANVLNIVVLTRRRMRSPVNVVLTCIAACDTGLMASYAVFLLHFNLRFDACRPGALSRRWLAWLVWHAVLSVALHASSLWLSVTMGFVRIFTLRRVRAGADRRPTVGGSRIRVENAWKLCMLVCLVVFGVAAPNLLSQRVVDATWKLNETCAEARRLAGGSNEPYSSGGTQIGADDHSYVDTDGESSGASDYASMSSGSPGTNSHSGDISIGGSTATAPGVSSSIATNDYSQDGGDDSRIIATTGHFGDDYDDVRYYEIGVPDCTVYTVNMWINGLLFKTVPCALLALSSFSLLRTIRRAQHRRRRLLLNVDKIATCAAQASVAKPTLMRKITGMLSGGSGATLAGGSSSSDTVNRASSTQWTTTFSSLARAHRKSRLSAASPATATTMAKTKRDRTTPMLLAILFIFLLTELPQGLVAVLSGIFSDFERLVYVNVADALDLLSLVNSSVNFFLYCAMSAKYRRAFGQLVLPRALYARWIVVAAETQRSPTDAAATNVASGGDVYNNNRMSK